jgi:DNA-binding PucR family transcriptional regulator
MAVRRPATRQPRDTVTRVQSASGRLATQALRDMDTRLPWFRAMPPEQRSWVGLVAQAGIANFVQWLREGAHGPALGADVFGAAPRELARMITLQQTVELVRVVVDVVESQVPTLAGTGDEARLREAVLRFSREVAFAAAGVYAHAAEERGAWDARLEALVVDALLRGTTDDDLRSRAAALGWTGAGPVSVAVGQRRDGAGQAVLDSLQRAARLHGYDVLAAVQADLLVVVLGGAAEPLGAVADLLPEFGDGPVVVGPPVLDLAGAAASARAALAGLRAAPAWPRAPRPTAAEDLLPERALAGDDEARHALVEKVYRPLAEAGGAVLDTVSAYVEREASLEGTARALFVHPNTVRYRLRRAQELTGGNPADPRDAFMLRLALAFGRLEEGLEGQRHL